MQKYQIFGLVAVLVIIALVVVQAKRRGQYNGAERALPIDYDESEVGLAMTDYRNSNFVSSRGWRNNNPGNLKISGEPWVSKVPKAENTDGTFEQFTKAEYGIRAMMKLLINYINNGRHSVHAIVSRYSTTDQQTYMQYVSQRTGYSTTEMLTANEATIKALTRAMIEYENLPADKKIATDTLLNRGWQLL